MGRRSEDRGGGRFDPLRVGEEFHVVEVVERKALAHRALARGLARVALEAVHRNQLGRGEIPEIEIVIGLDHAVTAQPVSEDLLRLGIEIGGVPRFDGGEKLRGAIETAIRALEVVESQTGAVIPIFVVVVNVRDRSRDPDRENPDEGGESEAHSEGERAEAER